MSRRRLLLSVVGLLAAALLVGVTALRSGDDAPSPDGPVAGPVAAAYAGAWEATCRSLSADATRTTAALRRRLGTGAPSTATRRRLARRVVAPYLGRTVRRLGRLQAAVPPPVWRAYHREAVAELGRATVRTARVRASARAGDLGDLAAALRPPAARSAAAPADLRARTPACRGAGGL